jgi:tetratricopeptide (TPR) repeat protein
LVVAYTRTGESRKAAALIERHNTLREQLGRKDNLAIGLYNLCFSQILLGELKNAESNQQRTLDIAQEIKDDFTEAAAHQQLGRLLTYMGRYDEADKEIEKALGIHATRHHEQGQCLDWFYRAVRALFMDDPKSGLRALEKAREFWELDAKHDYPVERDLLRILWLSGSAKRRLDDLPAAETDLNDALSRCRRIRLVEFEADILLEIAKLHWQKAAGKDAKLMQQAETLTREAIDIADRCEYRLQQADIHNFLAEIALTANDKPAARKHAETARDRAYCDGPPHCYKKALDTAEQILATLPTN